MSSGFDSFDWSGSESWQAVERNLYFASSSQAENDRVLLRRKRKWYKQNIDPSFEWVEEEPRQTYGNKQEQAQQQQQQAKSESSTRSSYVPPASSSPNASAAPKSKHPYGVYISWLQLSLHVLVLLSVLTYLLPLAGVEQQTPSFFRCMLLSLAAQAIYLVRQHGRPRWSAEYAQQVFRDEQSHFLFASLVLLNASPSILLLAPFFSRSLLFVCGGLKQLLPKASPRVYALVAGPIEKVVGLYGQIYSTNALLEVFAGFMLIVNLLTPSRNLMILLGYWQYLRIRYMLSADSKRAFGIVRTRTDGWVAHPMCPPLARTVYGKVVTAMENAADQERLAAQAQEGGIMSKCTIM